MSTFPWKKNLPKLPQELLDKARSSQQPIIVAAAKEIQEEDLMKGLYAHLGLRLEGEELRFLSRVAPPSKSGRWSPGSTVTKPPITDTGLKAAIR